MSETLTQKLWRQYVEALTATIRLPGVPQLVSPYEPWNWGGQDSLGMPSHAQYTFLDRIPASPIVEAQDVSAMPAFADQYQLFLTQLKLAQDGMSTPEYRKLASAASAAQAAFNTALQSASTAFANYVNSRKDSTTTFDQWLEGPGASYALQIDQKRKVAKAAQAAVDDYLVTFAGPVADALDAFQQNQSTVTTQDGKSVDVPMWFTSQQPYPYTLQITGNNFGGPATRGTAHSFTLTQDSQEFSYEHVYGDASARLSLGFFSIQLANGSYEKVDMSRFGSSYAITFAFEDLASVSVNPGEWFNGGMLLSYQNGPFQTGQHGFKSEGIPFFFGEGGSLSRMHTALVVGYRPSITIEGGTAFASYVSEKVRGGAGMRVGPFVIGVAGGAENTAGSVEVNGAAVKVVSTGDWPFLVATVSGWTVAPRDLDESAPEAARFTAIAAPEPAGV